MKLTIIPRINRATHAIATALGADRRLDVTQAEAHILALLHESGPARISDLYERFGVRRSTLTSVLDRLEHRALIERRTDPDDRRSFVVATTHPGRSVAATVHRTLGAIEESLLAGLTAADRARIARTLDRMVASAAARSA